MADRLHLGFKIGEFRVLPVQGELLSADGRRQRVPPRAMEVLLCLAGSPGEMVSRRRLREAVWGRGQPVSEETVTRCIGELRQLLGDQAEAPRYIQTVPGRGYRLIPEPLALGAAGAEADAARAAPLPGAGLLADLMRRKVFRVAASYVVVAWLLLQVGDVVLDALPFMPEGSMTFLVVALATGFPVAVVLAWAFQLTPQGMVVDPAGGAGDGGTAPARVHPMVYLVGAVSALAVGMLAYVLTSGRGDAPAMVEAQESIAVLPFVNMSDDRRNEYFSDGLTEEILNVLARIGELQVASRTSSFYFKGKDLDITEIAGRLSVRYVLEGSVRLSGDSMRVTAQLIDGQNGFHLWSETYDRGNTDVFAVQSDIAQQVARNLKLVLSGASRRLLSTPPTDNYEAYDFYLRGRDYLRRPAKDENFDNALRMFQQAVELDAGFSLAQAGICETRLNQYREQAVPEQFEQAERACNRALTRDPEAAEVLAALGELHRTSGQLELSLDEFDKAIATKPRFAEAYLGRAETLAAAGRTQEAEAAFRESIEIDRGHWASFQALGNYYFSNGRYAEAADQYQEVIRRTPDNANAYNNLAAAHFLQGDFQSAAEIWLKALEIVPSTLSYANVGTMYFYLGRFADALPMYRKAIELAPQRHLSWGGLADSLAQLPGREAEASQAYQEAARLAEQALTVNPSDAETMAEAASYRAALGQHEDAARLLEPAGSIEPKSFYYFYSEALVLLRRGDLVQAEDALMRAVELGFDRKLLAADAGFVALRGRPRFEALVGERGSAGQ